MAYHGSELKHLAGGVIQESVAVIQNPSDWSSLYEELEDKFCEKVKLYKSTKKPARIVGECRNYLHLKRLSTMEWIRIRQNMLWGKVSNNSSCISSNRQGITFHFSMLIFARKLVKRLQWQKNRKIEEFSPGRLALLSSAFVLFHSVQAIPHLWSWFNVTCRTWDWHWVLRRSLSVEWNCFPLWKWRFDSRLHCPLSLSRNQACQIECSLQECHLFWRQGIPLVAYP